MKPTITVTYTIEFVLDHASNYGFTKCKRCFNLKTGREIKQVNQNNCLGYNINGKFKSLTSLRTHLVKTKNLPF